jgi:hypothetical protein
MSFDTLKKNSNSSFEKLTRELEKISSSESGGADERFWKAELDKSGNGYAVIRFLPAPTGEDLPWAKVFSHAFQGPGGWYIENSLTTIGKSDPVGDLNRELWNSGSDADKEVARKQKRKLSYFSNIYVVRDPVNPQNEGKVFLFKYGKKIFDKIMGSMQPEFEDETPINPFDFWKGADFKLKITKVAGYWNYDKSEFASPSVLGNFDDDKLESIFNQEHSLISFTDGSNFKTYEELEKRMNMVLKGRPQKKVDMETMEDEDEVYSSPNVESVTPSIHEDTGEEDTMSFFAKLAQLED